MTHTTLICCACLNPCPGNGFFATFTGNGEIKIPPGITRVLEHIRPVDRGEMGEVFPGPATFGGPLRRSKNTEKDVPDGFFLTSNMHKIYFRPGLRPGPRLGSLQYSPRRLVGWWGDTLSTLHVSSLSFLRRLDCGAYRMRLWGPRDNGFPDPVVALDGPGTHSKKISTATPTFSGSRFLVVVLPMS